FTGGASITVAAAAHAYAAAGRTDEARRRLSELVNAPPGRYVQHYGVALVCDALGDTDEAFRWLELAYHDHSFWLAMWVDVGPRGLRPPFFLPRPSVDRPQVVAGAPARVHDLLALFRLSCILRRGAAQKENAHAQ